MLHSGVDPVCYLIERGLISLVRSLVSDERGPKNVDNTSTFFQFTTLKLLASNSASGRS